MSNLDYSKTCRTCLSETNSLKSIYSIQNIPNKPTLLCDMLMSCSSILANKEDGLPSNICLTCLDSLDKAFSFRELCEKSDHILRTVTETKVDNELLSENNLQLSVGAIIETFKSESRAENHEQYSLFGSFEPNPDSKSDEEKPFKVKKKRDEPERKRKEYTCEECKEVCLGLAQYWKHMANVHGKSYKCPDCDKEFKTQQLLTLHKIASHKIEEENETTDIETRHLPRTCEICNKSFRFHSNLVRHKLIHTGEKPYLCNVCGKGFGQLSYLKIHSFIHTGEKPYKCKMCDKSFAAPGTLMTHRRIHTGERPHVCKICGKDFPQSGYLTAHIRTHTGEKPVECKVCHRRFNQSGRLIIHMRIHSGEKPYSCKDCGRSFAVRGTLKKHMRTHTGERPYICSVCGQAFAQSGTLSTHMKVHKPKT